MQEHRHLFRERLISREGENEEPNKTFLRSPQRRTSNVLIRIHHTCTGKQLRLK